MPTTNDEKIKETRDLHGQPAPDRRFRACCIAPIALFVVALLSLPLLATHKAHTGTMIAQVECKWAQNKFFLLSDDFGQDPVILADLTDEERSLFRGIGDRMGRSSGARILVAKTTDSVKSSEGKYVIAVCDTAFEKKIPRWYRKTVMVHFICYTDGYNELITPEEFSQIDLSKFVDVRTIAPEGNLSLQNCE